MNFAAYYPYNAKYYIYFKRGIYMRIYEHPILSFERGNKIKFTFDGKEYEGYEGDTIASALHASGVKVLGHSHKDGRPRGFYCAIGNCSSCLMTVDGEPNVRVCIEKLKEGMVVTRQKGKGVLK
jgi:predicted molibdopterin-dependent oxidoreductase YjgC